MVPISQRSRVLRCKLTERQDVKDLDDIRAWAIANSPSNKTSTHWWHTAPNAKTSPSAVLPDTQRSAFDRIAKCETIKNMFESRFAKVLNLTPQTLNPSTLNPEFHFAKVARC